MTEPIKWNHLPEGSVAVSTAGNPIPPLHNQMDALIKAGWQVLIESRDNEVSIEVWNLPSNRRYKYRIPLINLSGAANVVEMGMYDISKTIERQGPLKPFEISRPVNQVALRDRVPSEYPEAEQTLGLWVSWYRRTIAPIHGEPTLAWYMNKMYQLGVDTSELELSNIERGAYAPTTRWLNAFCSAYKVSDERRSLLFIKRDELLRRRA